MAYIGGTYCAGHYRPPAQRAKCARVELHWWDFRAGLYRPLRGALIARADLLVAPHLMSVWAMGERWREFPLALPTMRGMVPMFSDPLINREHRSQRVTSKKVTILMLLVRG